MLYFTTIILTPLVTTYFTNLDAYKTYEEKSFAELKPWFPTYRTGCLGTSSGQGATRSLI